MVRTAILILMAVVPVAVEAGVPMQINHQGVVSVSGVRFNGTGLFRFAIIVDPGPSEVFLWTNESASPSPGTPTAAVSVSVTNGVYSVALGDASPPTNMTPIPSTVFNDNNVVLRIWFDDGTDTPNSIERLMPDHELSTSPYTFRAATADTATTASAAEQLNIPGSQTAAVKVIASGKVGIGTATPSALLTIQGANQNASGALRIQSGSVTKGWNIFPHDVGAFSKLRFNNGLAEGVLSDTGVWISGSDRAYKKDIAPMRYGLEELMKLQPREYRMKATDTKQIGFVAQEVESILPELVSGEEGAKGMSYGQLTAVLTRAVQQQQTQIEELKVENDALKIKYARIAMQEKEIAELTARLERMQVLLTKFTAHAHDVPNETRTISYAAVDGMKTSSFE